jgi:hypothetical protein
VPDINPTGNVFLDNFCSIFRSIENTRILIAVVPEKTQQQKLFWYFFQSLSQLRKKIRILIVYEHLHQTSTFHNIRVNSYIWQGTDLKSYWVSRLGILWPKQMPVTGIAKIKIGL